MPEQFMQKIRSITVLLGLFSLLGCDSGSKNPANSSESPASSRPALRLLIVDAPELEKEISVRWQAASDQLLKIENISSREVGTREPFQSDVVIFPGVLLGDLIKKEAIGRLPVEAIAIKESDSTQGSVVSAWPVRWRNSATFGGQLYAVPLGATNLGAILSGADSAPLDELQKLLGSSKDPKVQSLVYWNQLLENIEAGIASSSSERELLLQELLAKIGDEVKDSLVDRFLFIASTTNAPSHGLFDLLKMEARLAQSEFVNAVKILARLARLSPGTIAVQHAKAWELAAANRVGTSVALGWPSSIVAQTEDGVGAPSKIAVAPIVWNTGRGLIASVAKNTKQTAVSCQFLLWLGEPEQRDALRAVCSRVELLPGQSDRLSGQDHYRAYQTINNRDSRVEPMELSLRMANANQYRAVLSDCLVSAIQSPDRIDSIMAGCASKWDELTLQLGVDSQRISEEQSLGYRK